MTLRLNGDTSGFTEIKAPNAAGDNSITLPTSNGGANQLLQNGGTAGALQYTSAGGGLAYDSNGDLMLGASSFTGFAGADRRFLINGATNARQEFGVGGSQIGGLYADSNRLVVYTSASDHLSLQTNGTERVQLASTGELKLMSNCPGIDFSGIQTNAAGMTSETLDSYEEGTWTPTTTLFTHSTDATECRYTKIGRVVYLTGQISRQQVTNPGNGVVILTGLPFAQSAATRSISGNYWLDNGGNTSDTIGGITYLNNTTDIIFAIQTTPSQQASARYIVGNNFNNTRGVLFSATYITD